MSSNISFALNLQSEPGQKAIMGRLESELRILENLKKFLNIQIRAGREYSISLINGSSSAIKALIGESTHHNTSSSSSSHGNIIDTGHHSHAQQQQQQTSTQSTPLMSRSTTTTTTKSNRPGTTTTISSTSINNIDGGTGTGTGTGTTPNMNTTTDSIVSQVCLHVLEEVQSSGLNFKENTDYLNIQTLKQLNELIVEKKLLIKGSHDEYSKIKGKLEQFNELVNKCKNEYLKIHGSYEIARNKYEEQCATITATAANTTTGSSKIVNIGKRSSGGNDEINCKEKDKFIRTKKRLNIAHTEYLIALHEMIEYERDFRTILLPGLLQVEQTWCEKEIINWSEILEQIWNNGPTTLSSMTVIKKFKDFEFSKEYIELISQYKCQPLQPSNLKFEPANSSSTQPMNQSNIIVDSNTIDFLKNRLTETEKRIKTNENHLTEKIEQHTKLGSTLQGDLKSCEISQVRCENERLHSLKNFLDGHLKRIGLQPDGGVSPTLSRTIKLTQNETNSLKSEGGGGILHKKTQGGGSGNFLASLFRTAAARSRKAVSFDEDSSSPLIPMSTNTKSISNSIISGLPISENETSNVIVDKNMTSLLEQEWFHGVLPREDVVRLLRLQGDFLVRETVKNDERQIVLSVFWNGPKHFIIQVTPDGQFRFEGPFYPTVKELIDHYIKAKHPITNRSGAVIKKSVKRENWELNNDDVQLIEKIGRGNFGDVYKACYNGCLVAVKTCKVNLPEEQKKKFLQEGRILKQYDHINIVRFVGICVQKQPIMIVMEIVSGGSLLTYLKNKGSTLSVRQKTKLCLDASAGMKYLEEKGCIHRDLAARNCLIDENTTVKISDFGMSREEHEYTVSDGMKQIPIKWTAPEALNYGKYTSLSDVWSYGILMWEIFAHGSTPYSGMTNTRAREMIEAGYRMPSTDGMPDVIYQLMTRCWQYEPEQRPRFCEIHSELEILSVSDLI